MNYQSIITSNQAAIAALQEPLMIAITSKAQRATSVILTKINHLEIEIVNAEHNLATAFTSLDQFVASTTPVEDHSMTEFFDSLEFTNSLSAYTP